MKRSDFLKKIGICAIIAPFTPQLLAEIPKTDGYNVPIGQDDITTHGEHLRFVGCEMGSCCLGDIYYFNGGEYMVTRVPYFPGEMDYALTPIDIKTNNGQSIFVSSSALNDAFKRVR